MQDLGWELLLTQLCLQLAPDLQTTIRGLAADSATHHQVVQMLLEYRITTQAFLESNLPGEPLFHPPSGPAKPCQQWEGAQPQRAMLRPHLTSVTTRDGDPANLPPFCSQSMNKGTVTPDSIILPTHSIILRGFSPLSQATSRVRRDCAYLVDPGIQLLFVRLASMLHMENKTKPSSPWQP